MKLFFTPFRANHKADIRNPHSLLAHEHSRFATCVQNAAHFVGVRIRQMKF